MILASDGLWDVMSSEEAVQYVHSIMARAIHAGSGDGSGESLRSAVTEAAVLCIVYLHTRVPTHGSTAGNAVGQLVIYSLYMCMYQYIFFFRLLY